MLKLERQLFIEKELHEKGSVLVSELSRVLDCSEETIRRDINGGSWKAQQDTRRCLSAG